ncbi:hypothetical protein [Blastochloris tepida]|uniref:Uncharacterized protein n=1 Tax=Blastochloris tepida TaxID=2233851 RepID=A0A348FZW1_9HYPH|nr:hypothetical protein [Blastochloris tepida]BBF92844.1 hypothetical protein BLTE_15290 [Blastochloris tepida]
MTLKEQAEALVALCGQLDAKRAQALDLVEQIRAADAELWKATGSPGRVPVGLQNAIARTATEYIADPSHRVVRLADAARTAYAEVLRG